MRPDTLVTPTTEVYCWPERPLLPPCGVPLVVRVNVDARRPVARLELRAALRELLAEWSGLTPDLLPLAEAPRGPIWLGALAGETLDISFSYAGREGWIGLIRGGSIGVDVMSVDLIRGDAVPTFEIDSLARLYLGPAAAAAIRAASNPPLAFATAWTLREASLKCLKRGLDEWTEADADIPCHGQTLAGDDGLIGAVVTSGAECVISAC
jgi:4'-phosphopantetheinyl transferase